MLYSFLRDWHTRRFLISPVDIKAQTKNPKEKKLTIEHVCGRNKVGRMYVVPYL